MKEQLRQNIINNRKLLGMSQKELGEKLHTASQTVSSWESGRSLPSLETIETMAEVFGVSEASLLGIHGDPVYTAHTESECLTALAALSSYKYIMVVKTMKGELLETTDSEIEPLKNVRVTFDLGLRTVDMISDIETVLTWAERFKYGLCSEERFAQYVQLLCQLQDDVDEEIRNRFLPTVTRINHLIDQEKGMGLQENQEVQSTETGYHDDEQAGIEKIN